MSLELKIGSRVSLKCSPSWVGQVVGFDGHDVLLAFKVGDGFVTGRHSLDAFEAVGACRHSDGLFGDIHE